MKHTEDFKAVFQRRQQYADIIGEVTLTPLTDTDSMRHRWTLDEEYKMPERISMQERFIKTFKEN